MAIRPGERLFIFQIECGSFGVDHFAVLRDRNINVGAASGNLLPGSGRYGGRWLTLLRRLALGRAEPISGIAKPRFANGIARLTERRSDLLDRVEACERWFAQFLRVCAENLNASVLVMKSAKDTT